MVKPWGSWRVHALIILAVACRSALAFAVMQECGHSIPRVQKVLKRRQNSKVLLI